MAAMARVLRNLKINEVSGVDKGAGRGVKIMLMKRHGIDKSAVDETSGEFVSKVGASVDALEDSIFSILSDDGVPDRQAALEETLKQFKDHMAGIDPAASMEQTDMTKEEVLKIVADETAAIVAASKEVVAKQAEEIAYLKMSAAHKTHCDKLDDKGKAKFMAMTAGEKDKAAGVDDGDEDDKKSPAKKIDEEVAKKLAEVADENVELKKQLGELMGDKQREVFRKRAVEAGLKDEDGEIMRKAFSGDLDAQSALIKRVSDTSKALKEQVKSGKLFAEFGKASEGSASAYGELQAKAAELRKIEPKLTEAQAFSTLMIGIRVIPASLNRTWPRMDSCPVINPA